MAEQHDNDTMDAILSEMEGFKCRNLETGEMEKCHPISGYLHDRIKDVYERDTKELVDSLRETTQCMCAHCQFKPCEENERDENGFHLPCRVVYEAQRLIAKYESFGKKDNNPNENGEISIRLSCMANEADSEEDRKVLRTSALLLLGKMNNASRFFTVEGAKEAFHKEFCACKCDTCSFKKHRKSHLGDNGYCFVRWLLNARQTKDERKPEQVELF